MKLPLSLQIQTGVLMFMRYLWKFHGRLAGVLLVLTATGLAAQSLSNDASKTQVRGYWIDPDTGLMWADKDSGKDVSYKGALKYCQKLRLAGYSDWRLADMFELQGIYDKSAEAPGWTGMRSEEPTTWHVKGSLFLTAEEWSSSYRKDDRGHFSGSAYYFDFNDGKSNDDPTGWPYAHSFRRALCVRGSGDPLGGQRRH